MLQQPRAKPVALGIWIYVQVVEPTLGHTGETEHPAQLLHDPDLVTRADPAAKLRAVFVRNPWQIRHLIPSSKEHLPNRTGVNR
jgi:hypothetical protein